MNGSLDHGVATTAFQLVAETLASAIGMRFNPVNYRGSAPVVTALMCGEIQVGVLDSAAVLPQLKTGRLVALGVTSAARTRVAPETPTIAEAGVPGYAAAREELMRAPTGRCTRGHRASPSTMQRDRP